MMVRDEEVGVAGSVTALPFKLPRSLAAKPARNFIGLVTFGPMGMTYMACD